MNKAAAVTEWVATTQMSQWQTKEQVMTSPVLNAEWDVEARLDKPLQTIDGFGPCFNELGWVSLGALGSEDRDTIFQELFAPGVGAKTAASLLARYGTLEAALEDGRFSAVAEDLRLYRRIATVDASAPLPPLEDQDPTWAEASALAREWDLNGLADRLAKLAA